jgi:dsRNA-specific ribonuclease
MLEELIVPYNINNILITKDDIKILFQKYNLEIEVKNINYYITALTHKSYIMSEYTNYNNK